ncbi:MAG: quinolinate synthase NadA [Bacteroidales bacterium]|nr:quinolinate synthase NadA [Bacteroidales bacterium]
MDLEEFGFLKLSIPPDTDIKSEIERLRKEKNVVILAHFYQSGDIQDIADHVGDSLALAQAAESTTADIILFSGVHFMAETAKILNPDKKVLLPDLKAGCSLAESCDPAQFRKFVEAHPDHTVISYINTTAEIKALTDIICTSSNALHIINSIPADEKIIFAPDRNLGNYLKSQTGRDMLVWDGACHVHEEFSLEKILEIKEMHPDAKIIAHPECERPLLLVADHIGSTSSLLNFTKKDPGKKYIVATEAGILHQMRKFNSDKLFIPAPPKDSTCACNDCNFMKLNSMEKIYNALRYEMPELTMDSMLIEKSLKPIKRMLEISAKFGL